MKVILELCCRPPVEAHGQKQLMGDDRSMGTEAEAVASLFMWASLFMMRAESHH